MPNKKLFFVLLGGIMAAALLASFYDFGASGLAQDKWLMGLAAFALGIGWGVLMIKVDTRVKPPFPSWQPPTVAALNIFIFAAFLGVFRGETVGEHFFIYMILCLGLGHAASMNIIQFLTKPR